MHIYLGDTGIMVYDIIGIIAFFPLLYFIFSQKKEKDKLIGKLSLYLKDIFSKSSKETRIIKELSKEKTWANLEFLILFIINMWCFMFGGYTFADLFMKGRRTDFYGYTFETAFLFLVVCIIFRIDWLKLMDLVTPNYAFLSGFLKIACFFHGCCGTGVEWLPGFYNQNTCRYEFPIQLVEVALSFVLFFILLYLRKRVKVGRLYPIYVISYSILRFVYNIFKVRDDVFLVFDLQQTTSIVSLGIGITLFMIIMLLEEKISKFFNKEIILPKSKKVKKRKPVIK